MSIVMPDPYVYQVFNVNLSDGLNDYRVPIAAEKLIYNNGAVPIRIKLNSTSNQPIILKPKMSIEAPISDFFISSDAWEETIQLICSNPSNIQIGGNETRVISDTGYFDSWNQQAFSGYNHIAASNGYQLYTQLWNKPDSEIYAIVDEILISQSGANHGGIKDFFVGFNLEEFDPSGNWYNKYSYGPLPVCEIRELKEMAGVRIAQWFYRVSWPNDDFAFTDHNPNFQYILTPGHGLIVQGYSYASTTQVVTFQWREFQFRPDMTI